jgi:maltose alpha-D-glucosyltransferase/alpha-amylase
MVSDEERDYMYRVYAVDHRMRVNVGIRRRLAPLLNNDRRLIELMNGLLFALPGTPVLYYGDEIGMGDNIYLGDRNGVRTPMQWSADKNAGFSRANPQRLPLPIIIDPEYHYEAINVEAQQGNPRSLLWHMKRLIALRKQVGILGRAGTTLLYPDNPRVLAFVRGDGSRKILIVANLSHLVQHAELDLTAYRGLIPVELLGRSEFPPLDDRPSAFTLGPYDFFWFSLNAPTPAGLSPLVRTAPVLRAEGSWPILEEPGIRSEIENLIPSYLLSRRWFRAKALIPRGARLRPLLTVGRDELLFRVGLVDVEFSDVEPQLYTLPLAFAEGAHATELKKSDPGSVLAEFRPEGNAPERLLYDASQDPEFVRFLVDQMRHNRTHRVDGGEMVASRTSQFNGPDLPSLADLPITSIKAEQSNSSVRIGDRFIFKLYRAIGGGINPEREIGLFLLRQETPAPAALVAGSLDYLQEGRDPETLAVVHRWIPNEGDAWTMTLDHLREFFERIRAHLAGGQSLPVAASTKLEIALSEPPAIAIELVGTYLENARLLGVRTADLHKILGNDASDPAFAPEPYDQLYVRSIYQTMQTYRSEVFDLLRNRRPTFSPNVQALADSILAHEEGVEARYRALLGRKFGGQRIRIHGDYHLGQVLWTGKDFVIIDFEGEPLRALSERRIKRYPLRDVAGMLRSFDYAANAALRVVETTGGTPELREGLAGAGKLWLAWVSSVFLAAYRKEMHGSRFLTSDPAELQTLMNAYLFEKAVYELRYELNNRPDWVEVPLLGLRYLLGIQA